MKAYLLVVALAVAPACGKKNEVPVLEHEATVLAKYYQPKLDVVDTRLKAIMDRGAERKPDKDKTPVIRGDLPGIQELTAQLQQARDTAAKLRGIVGTEKDSPLVTQAKQLAKENRADLLGKLVHDTEVTLDGGMTIIQTNLDAAELWLFNFDNGILALPAAAKGEQPEPTGTPATPATPATGQPPAAEQGSAAAPAPKADATQPAQPKAPAQNK